MRLAQKARRGRARGRSVCAARGAFMIALLRLALVTMWLAWSQALGALAGVERLDLLVAVPVAVLATAGLVPLVVIGARAIAVALTISSVWLLAVTTWGLVGGSLLLATACFLAAVAACRAS